MQVKVTRLRGRLINNYWFVPAAMVTAAIGLAFLLPWVDHAVGSSGALVPGWIYQGGPEGARVLLSTISGSMITVAALTFSITIVGLSMASQQFGPRLLRNFIRDRGYQLVLGTFLAAFIYCLLVLRTVRSTGSPQFVPYISLTVGHSLRRGRRRPARVLHPSCRLLDKGGVHRGHQRPRAARCHRPSLSPDGEQPVRAAAARPEPA